MASNRSSRRGGGWVPSSFFPLIALVVIVFELTRTFYVVNNNNVIFFQGDQAARCPPTATTMVQPISSSVNSNKASPEVPAVKRETVQQKVKAAPPSLRAAVQQEKKYVDPHNKAAYHADPSDKSWYEGKHYDVCVVGAGLSGAIFAERHANEHGHSVLVMEKRDHIGGNCYDYIDEDTGVRVSKYGAHLFHTIYDRVWQYVQRFSEWTPYEHEVLGWVDGKHVPIPVNIDTVNSLFGLNISSSEQMDEWLKNEQIPFDEPKNSEEMSLSRVGPRLHELIFKPYTVKQWDKEPKELGPEVLARIPVRNNHDARYFADPHQALPKNGYTAIFENMFDHPKINVKTKVDYFDIRDNLSCGHTYFTGPIDVYYASLGWDKLEYRSLDFERQVHRNTDYFQPKSVVNHPSSENDFTRIVEYKHLPTQATDPSKLPHTVIYIERSKEGGEPYYPVPNERNKALYAKYQKMTENEKDVTFAGRLASYKYFNMDQSIENALTIYEDRMKKLASEATVQVKPSELPRSLTAPAAQADKKYVDPHNKAAYHADPSDKSWYEGKHYDVCVVGAGLSGAIFAERHANEHGHSVLVMEKRDHIGGNCYDYIDEDTGVRVSKYGAHLFHTVYDRVWEYVQRFSEWTPYEHEVLGWVDGKHVPIPVNIDTVNSLFGLNISSSVEMDEWLKNEQIPFEEPKNSEEMSLSRVGPRLHELIFKPYTVKQWDKEPKELGPEVLARIPVRNNHDARYFADPHQALPKKGYTAIFENMFDHPKINVKTKVDYFDIRDNLSCGHTYFTGPIDVYYAALGWDKLEYRSLDFERQVHRNTDYFQPKSVVNHPSSENDFTRIVEYKHLPTQATDPSKLPHTVIYIERSKEGGEPYYPVPNERNKALYAKYQKMTENEKDVTFAGRLASYKYFNMDQSIENALTIYEDRMKKLIQTSKG